MGQINSTSITTSRETGNISVVNCFRGILFELGEQTTLHLMCSENLKEIVWRLRHILRIRMEKAVVVVIVLL